MTKVLWRYTTVVRFISIAFVVVKLKIFKFAYRFSINGFFGRGAGDVWSFLLLLEQFWSAEHSKYLVPPPSNFTATVAERRFRKISTSIFKFGCFSRCHLIFEKKKKKIEEYPCVRRNCSLPVILFVTCF